MTEVNSTRDGHGNNDEDEVGAGDLGPFGDTRLVQGLVRDHDKIAGRGHGARSIDEKGSTWTMKCIDPAGHVFDPSVRGREFGSAPRRRLLTRGLRH